MTSATVAVTKFLAGIFFWNRQECQRQRPRRLERKKPYEKSTSDKDASKYSMITRYRPEGGMYSVKIRLFWRRVIHPVVGNYSMRSLMWSLLMKRLKNWKL